MGERRADDTFRDVVERLDAIVWIAEVETLRPTLVTGRAVGLLGYSSEEWSADPGLLVARLHPEDRAQLETLCRRVADDGRDRQCEHRMLARDGVIVWLRTQVSPFFDGADRQRRPVARVCGVMTDITEQALSADALRHAYEFSTALLDTVDALVVVFDRNGRVVRFNRACERVTGYEAKAVKGRLGDFLVPEDERKAVSAAFRSIVAGHYPATMENHWVTCYGGRRHVSWSNTALLDSDGKVEHVVATGIDITDRTHAEEALREANQLLTSLIESVPLGFVALDRDGTVRTWNPAAERLFGWTSEEVVGRTSPMLSDDASSFSQMFAAALGGQTVTEREDRRRRKDGTTIELRISSAPVRNAAGEIVGTMAAFADLTERRRAEEERDLSHVRERAARAIAEEQQHRSAFLAEASTVLGSSLDFHTTLTAVARLALPYFADWGAVDMVQDNGTIRRVAVIQADATKSELAERLARIHPIPNAPDGSAWTIRTGKPILRNDITLATLQRSLDESMSAAVPYSSEQLLITREMGITSYMVVPLVARGRTLGALTFVSATAARRYGPQDLELAQNVAQRAAVAVDNARLYQEAQQAIELRGEFLSIASHELRTPITSLLLAVQSLLRIARTGRLSDVPEDFLTSAIETAERQGRHLAHLVDSLLDVSRLEAGHFELYPSELDIAAVVRDAASSVREEMERHGCALTLHGEQQLVGDWDRTRIQQVITNLLSNAMKYGAGSPIDVMLEGDADIARIVVIDQGIGIAPDQQLRIFERFGRAVPARNYGGLGLGLYIVRRIVEAHGGAVRVASQPGKGAAFTVELPRRQGTLPSP